MMEIIRKLIRKRRLRLRAEMVLDGKKIEKIAYIGVHRAGFTKLFLGYAMLATRYDEYDDHIIVHFDEDRPLYFSYNRDTDFVLMYADEVCEN